MSEYNCSIPLFLSIFFSLSTSPTPPHPLHDWTERAMTQPLPADAVKNLLAEVLPPTRIEELEETQELNMAHAIPGIGNFRISAMRQRGTIAAVIRYITVDVPPLEDLNVPIDRKSVV